MALVSAVEPKTSAQQEYHRKCTSVCHHLLIRQESMGPVVEIKRVPDI